MGHEQEPVLVVGEKHSIGLNALPALNVDGAVVHNMYKQLHLRFEREDNQMEFDFVWLLEVFDRHIKRMEHIVLSNIIEVLTKEKI